MINPHLLTHGYTKQFEPRFAGGKFYRPRVQVGVRLFHCRRIFGRASQAEAYSKRVIDRWCRLYDAMIVNMIAPVEGGPAQPAAPAGEVR